MKIGLLGGTFDPVHKGHLMQATQALSALKLDVIYFVPTYQPPHKKCVTPAIHRLRMLKIALRKNEKLKISQFEMDHHRKSYTIFTLKYFKRKFKNAELYFILGEDLFQHIDKWKESKKLFDYCSFIVTTRAGYANPKRVLSDKIIYKKIRSPLISSSEIRKNISKSRKYLESAVFSYIQKNKLYEN